MPSFQETVRVFNIHIGLIMCFSYINLFNICKIYSSYCCYEAHFEHKEVKALKD